jgi:hypothetical protein
LADLPLYQEEKPFYILPGVDEQIDIQKERLTNLHFTSHQVHISDIRNREEYTLNNAGFEVVPHTSKNLKIHDLAQLAYYKEEIEAFFKVIFPEAVYVRRYDYCVRYTPYFIIIP